MVMIDQRTKYSNVDFMRSTSARNVIFALERFFGSYGIPNNIVSDNDPPFTSYKLQRYFTSRGIKHHKTCPLWPQANGQVERFMPSLNKVSQTAFLERKDWKLEIYKFLLSYRNCPHATTKMPLSDLMFNRKVKLTIPQIDNKTNIDNINNELEKNICASKQHAKEYHDKRHHTKNFCLQIGDRVIVKQRKLNKLTPIFEATPFIAIETKGTLLKAREENSFPNNISHESDMTLNIVYTTILIKIKIPGVIPYVTDNPLADMALHLKNTILISHAIYIFHYSRTGYFRFIFFFR